MLDIKSTVRSHMDYIVFMRRHFHMYPEPSTKEVETSRRIAKELDNIDVNYRVLDNLGIIATIRGTRSGKTIALRADFDALMIQENSGYPYASKNEGFMHACGHDGHTAMLLGVARILANYQDFSGEIRLLFQPAEEVCLGAKGMIAQGALEGVDTVFGMHIALDESVGKLSATPGVRTSAADYFTLSLTGDAAPEAAAAVILALQTIASREVDPLEIFVLTCGSVSTKNGTVEIQGTCRYTNIVLLETIDDKIERLAKNTAAIYGCNAKLSFEHITYPINNTKRYTDLAKKVIAELYGENANFDSDPSSVSEDFAYYLREVEGMYAILGANNTDSSLVYPNHHPMFNFNEEALFYGTGLYIGYALRFLNSSSH